MIEKYIFHIWYKNKKGFFYLILLFFSVIYYCLWKLNDFIYCFIKKSKKLPCPVISVGNITLGGTGKTPFILYLINFLKSKGINKITILTRGYKSDIHGEINDKNGEPDESRMLKRNFPHITILAHPDRLNFFESFYKNKELPEIVILDDGFQHRKIHRDLNIVMIDGTLMFGNEKIFPAGPLREPVNTILNRADLLVLKDGNEKNLDYIKSFFKNFDVLNFKIEGVSFRDNKEMEVKKEILLNKELIAFCGIGNPDSFYNLLSKEKLEIKDFISFADHFNYTHNIIKDIIGKYKGKSFITTEKDWIKIRSIWDDSKELFIAIPIFKLEDEKKFEALYEKKICIS